MSVSLVALRKLAGFLQVVEGAEGPSLLDSKDLRGNLDFMMAHYESELKKPIRSLVTGRLPRTLLIQVWPPRSLLRDSQLV